MMIHGSRGQAFSTDALLALIVFTLLLALTIGLVTQIQRTGEESRDGLQRSFLASQVLTHLLSTEGDPLYWNTLSDRNQVMSLGLIGYGGSLSPAKWEQFRDWNADDYSNLKSRMGMGDQNFHLLIMDINRDTLSQAGIAPVDVNEVASITLPAYYNGDLVYVQLQVHRR